jgi:hypothetical protein
MAITNGSVLDSLVTPAQAQHFLSECWPERIYYAHGPLSRLPALFSSSELSDFRALAAVYKGWLGFGQGARSSRMLSVQEVNPLHLYEMGLSVYLPDIAANVPGADPFLRQLELELGIEPGCSRITVWASPRSDGAATHFDAEDVISIQLTGSKKFEIAPMREYTNPYGSQFGPGVPAFDDMYPQLDKGFPEVVESEFQSIDMQPGSVLFMPRGTWHRTTAEQDSFSVSIMIRPPCMVDAFLEQLKYVLLQDSEWRRPLYGVRGNAGQRKSALEWMGRVLETAPRATQAISASDIAQLPDFERLNNIERSTSFQRDLGTRIEFEQGVEGQFLQVKTWSREGGEQNTLKMNVPPQYQATFNWLADSRVAFTAGELADRFKQVPFEQHQKILDVLTRGKYLRLLWFPRLAR